MDSPDNSGYKFPGELVDEPVEVKAPAKGYVETCLEDLATDQLRTEEQVASLIRQVRVLFLVAGAALGLGILGLKLNKMIVGNMNQLGEALLATQQATGLVPGAGVPMPERTPAPAKPVVEDAVEVGDTVFDPGPQEIPAEVREKIETEPLPADPHDDGNGLR